MTFYGMKYAVFLVNLTLKRSCLSILQFIFLINTQNSFTKKIYTKCICLYAKHANGVILW